jgi:PAS domain S-box-containing protein
VLGAFYNPFFDTNVLLQASAFPVVDLYTYTLKTPFHLKKLMNHLPETKPHDDPYFNPSHLDFIFWEATINPIKIFSINQRAVSLLGYPLESWISEEHFFLAHLYPDDKERVTSLLKKAIENERDIQFEHRFRASDGRILWFSTEIKVIKGEDRSVSKITAMMINITDRKQAETKFLVFLESAPDAIVVVDREGRIVLVNSLTEEMFGYTRDEMLGQPIEILVPERYKKMHVQHRTKYSDTPKTRPMGIGRALTGLKKDGSEFPIEISLSPLQDEQGILVISIIRDITDRLRTEAKFRGFLEAAPDAVVVIDQAGKIVLVNTLTEKMFGYRREEMIGNTVELLVPVRYIPSHVKHRQDFFKDPKTRPMGAGQELAGKRKDGSEFPVEISLSPLETEQGVLVISIIRDISERKRAEEQIKTSLREKEFLLKEIHHRVKNNLQVTSSLLKLQSGYIEDARVREMFAEGQNRIRSMALVHEMLYQSNDLSRINFTEYVKSLGALLFRSFGVDTNLVHFNVEADDVFLSIDKAVPCGLILNELLSNCLKHAFPSGQKGEINIKIDSHSSEKFSIVVSDNGIGLPGDLNLEHRDSLGLRLVHRLVGQLDGVIEMINGHGTTFKILFTEHK